MISLAYVQKHEGEFFSEPTYAFWRGCQQLGIETTTFEQEAGVGGLDLSPDTLVYGGIGIIRKAFDKLGVKQPTIGEMPPAEILDFYGRRVWATTMLEVREGYEDNRHFFIKPLRKHKAFVGHVTSGELATLALTAAAPNDFEILASEVVKFEVEYRAFINRQKIIGCKHYKGNFRKLVDLAVADRVIEAYKQAPISYSLDLGLTPDGRTLVVEVNDAFSLGHYGLAPVPYTRMVVDRWEEIVGGSECT